MHLDKQHPKPIYLQLKDLLQNQIEQGVYLCHQQLPSERDLCQHFDLSRMTARRALQELIADGFAYTKAGKGTFVNDISNIKSANQTAFSDDYHLVYIQKLLAPLLSFDDVGTDKIIREALAKYSLETVACKWFPELIKSSEREWLKGKISLLVHNYAVTTLYSQLIVMMNAAKMPITGPKILLACAPGDRHEIGLILLSIILRRRGFIVIYMGSNFATDELHQTIKLVQPNLICLSAATKQSAQNLANLGAQFEENGETAKKSLFTYGGVIFSNNSTLTTAMPGQYLGDTIEKAAHKIQQLTH